MPLLAALALATGQSAIAADFNGDGKADIVWRLPAGNPLVWQMDGLSIQGQRTLSIAPDAASAIVGTGRFFYSGPDAIAWIDATHQLHLWQISDGTPLATCTVLVGIDATWTFLGIGDVNADGRDDILWLLPDGSVRASLINGCATPGALTIHHTANAAWTFVGLGDFNGDHYADLLWRTTASQLVEWRVSAGGSVTVGIVPTGAQANWQIVAIADFNDDGKADLLWRDPGSNALTLWLNGAGFTSTPVTAAASTTFAATDTIFANGYDSSLHPAPPLAADWTILGAEDFDGDGDADLLLADHSGSTAIWRMQGAVVQATNVLPPHPDMPLAGLTGWRLPLDRPHVTKAHGQVSVDWNTIVGSPPYMVYASAANDPYASGVAISSAAPPLTFGRNDAGYADKRYFSVSASYHGIQLPPSPEAYVVEFTPTDLPYFGAMAVADINRDGCIEILGALGDCHSGFTLLSETDMGLAALRAPGRVYRDLRFADLDGDGIDDLIANTYSSTNDSNSQDLFFRGIGNNQFVEDSDFTNLNIRGNGETIVIADFNGDGYLDVFLPEYTFHTPDEHCRLLLNDGHGHFTDVADAAGVAMRNVSILYRPEGAQAVDINDDGRIDLYAGSMLFINNGNVGGVPIFTNVGSEFDLNGPTSTSPWGLPAQFDEGAKFIDADNSGELALALNTVFGIRIFQYDGLHTFTEQDVIPPIYMNQSFGLTAADVDGDGRSDLVVAGGLDQSVETNSAYRELRQDLDAAIAAGNVEIDELLAAASSPNAMPQLLVNRPGQFVIHDYYDDGRQPSTRGWSDLQTFADFDYSGTPDIVGRFGPSNTAGYLTVLTNQASSTDIITVTVLGNNGEKNQAGRVVRLMPDAKPGITMSQVVDSGSGYMGNAPYDLTFAAPYPGAYVVAVRFASATVTTTAHIGDHVYLYANGTASIQP